MTRLIRTNINCPKCERTITIVIPASISIGGKSLLEDLINGRNNVECPDCGKLITPIYSILVCSPSNMFQINTGWEVEKIKKLLMENNLMDENGVIDDPFFSRLGKKKTSDKIFRWDGKELHPPPPK